MSDLPDLTGDEQRVLGSLLEKEVTVPGSYPMSVNAVRTACNQSSSREPVVEYDERHVHDTLRSLKAKDLVAVTWSDTGRRTMKYVQTVAVRLDLATDERALLTVLMLRGAQAPGALKSRTERLHAFGDREEVAACLARMAAREAPLVAEQPKRPREQDHRWVHLLGAVEEPTASNDPIADERENVLRDGEEARTERVRRSMDAVAAPYAENFSNEFEAGLPFERWLLDRVAAQAAGGPIVEVGCGPGHVTAYLAAAGAQASGLDLSPAMIEQARRRHPGLTFEVGDLRRLMRPVTSEGWSAVVGWYSLIYLAASEMPAAVASLTRPLASGGTLVVAVHAGSGVRHADSWFDTDVDLDVVHHQIPEVVAAMEAAGLVEVEWYQRGAMPRHGESSDRAFVLGRRP